MSYGCTPHGYLPSLPRYQSLEFLQGDLQTSYDFFGNPVPSISQTFPNGSLSNLSTENSVNDVAASLRKRTVYTSPFQVAAIPTHNQQSNTDDGNSKRFTSGMIGSGQALRSVAAEIPESFQTVFQNFPYFNIVQSKIMDDVFHSDKSLVVCAPTGSGKTVVFELAIIRLLMHCSGFDDGFKIIYMAPIKALCSERYEDWKEKFLPFGITCFELTGDTDVDNYSQLQAVNLILTTPEKWDSTTRRWRDYRYLLQLVKLFLIDEIHVVNDKNRGATIEAVISRMMTIHSDFNLKSKPNEMAMKNSIRFIAASATIPNTEDFAEWFGYGGRPSVSQKLGEEFRPVKLQKVVIGYQCPQNWTDFRFDMMLSYKLVTIINRYSEGKPSLVFCSTRKGVIQTSSILANESKLILSTQLKHKLVQAGNTIRENKLKDFITSGIGYHHAGLDYHDRKIVEELFVRGELPILIATSTLAMGVNLPAHLVILKSTMCYDNGQLIEYNDTQVLQMIGRAGRPQFDTSATAVIMTKDFQKAKYEKFINGTQIIESSLHKKLAEYLNVEIVLKTITDLAIAMQWIRSTFLYVRIMKNPTHYGLSSDLSKNHIEQKLQEMCIKELNSLVATQLIQMDEDGFDLKSTEAGRLMAQYCVSLNTMKRYRNVKGTETINDLLQLISASEEFCEIQLRTSEKKTLNTLNKDKHLQTIRFPMNGRIRNREMKINCLIQAAFGCIAIQDWTLSQETTRILRTGQRLSKCLSEYISIKDDFGSVTCCILLAKCFRARLWESSKHVARQLEKIGNSLSNNLVNSGLTTFQKIEETNPRQLELIMNRHPPFGTHVRDAVANLPKYEVTIEQIPKYSSTTADISVTVTLKNFQLLKDKGTPWAYPCAILIIGNQDNKIVFKQRMVNSWTYGTGKWSKRLNIARAQNGHELIINLINERYVGLDIHSSFTPFYIGGKNIATKCNFTLNNVKTDDLRETSSDDEFEAIPDFHHDAEKKQLQPCVENERRMCGHRCHNKATCAHECCKVGVNVKTSGKSSTATSSYTKTTKLSQAKKVQKEQTKGVMSNTIMKFCTDVKNKAQAMPLMSCSRTFTKASSKIEITDKSEKTCLIDLKRYEYKATVKSSFSTTTCDDIDNCWTDDVDDSYLDFNVASTEGKAERSLSRHLKTTSYSKEQHPSIPDDDFDEMLKQEDDDVVMLPYDGDDLDFYGDFPDMTVEDFQEDPSGVNPISKCPDSTLPSFKESCKFSKKRKYSPSFDGPTELWAVPERFPSSKSCHPPATNNIQAEERSKLKLSHSATTTEPVQNFETDFVSASKIYGDLLLDNRKDVRLDHQMIHSPSLCYRPKLTMQMAVADECNFKVSNVDHIVSDLRLIDTEKRETDLVIKQVSPYLLQQPISDSQAIITAEEIGRNPELRDAVNTYCHIFSDLF